VRDLVQIALHLEGLEVYVRDSGIGIESVVEELCPDVILLDVMMPIRDGYDVLRVLKSQESTCDIPVVLLTAKATDSEVWQGWQAGADYYLTKPFNVALLLEYLQVIVGERSFI
jgi:DNA-binding response OmpR family regulator